MKYMDKEYKEMLKGYVKAIKHYYGGEKLKNFLIKEAKKEKNNDSSKT